MRGRAVPPASSAVVAVMGAAVAVTSAIVAVTVAMSVTTASGPPAGAAPFASLVSVAHQAAAPPQEPAARAASAVDARASEAVASMRRAMGVVRAARERAPGWAPVARYDRDRDRAALIGAELTPLVSTMGPLEAKWVATDPRWAALLVRQFAARGVAPGSVVLASFSGSFPALNLAVMAAAHALGARVVAISSVTASTWGANEPGFTWPEMEVLVAGAGVLPTASVAVTLGATSDAGRGLEPEALALARRIQHDAARALHADALSVESLDEAIALRVAAYRQALDGSRPAAYVNVGGNHASLGGARAPLRHVEGWITALPPGATSRASVMVAWVAEGVPALSLLNVRRLAREWGLDAERAGLPHPSPRPQPVPRQGEHR